MKTVAVFVCCLAGRHHADCVQAAAAISAAIRLRRPSPVAREVAPVLLTEDARDIHSYAQPAIARVTHVDLDLTADFAAHTLAGTAALDVQAAAEATR